MTLFGKINVVLSVYFLSFAYSVFHSLHCYFILRVQADASATNKQTRQKSYTSTANEYAENILPRPPVISEFEEGLSVAAEAKQTTALSTVVSVHELDKPTSEEMEKFWIGIFIIQIMLLVATAVSALVVLKRIGLCFFENRNNRP